MNKAEYDIKSYAYPRDCYSSCPSPRYMTASEICITLHIMWKLNSIIVFLFIESISKLLTSLTLLRIFAEFLAYFSAQFKDISIYFRRYSS